MNAIATDFLNVIQSNETSVDVKVGQRWLASELAGKVERFMEWVALKGIEGYFDDDIIHEMQYYLYKYNSMEIEKRLTLSDLYSYWLENIDGK